MDPFVKGCEVLIRKPLTDVRKKLDNKITLRSASSQVSGDRVDWWHVV
jgi:hypothetical protein